MSYESSYDINVAWNNIGIGAHTLTLDRTQHWSVVVVACTLRIFFVFNSFGKSIIDVLPEKVNVVFAHKL